MFIDTHCHLSIDDYDDIDRIVRENIAAKVSKIIVSACTKSTFEEALSLSEKYDGVYVTLGFHPSEIDTDEADLGMLKKLLKNKKVVGVGEIGLDYHYGKDDIKEQKILFEKQLIIAEKLNLPVVIHSRDAVNDTIEMLKKHSNVKGVIHCFSGSMETADIYIKLGYKLGIGGVVTFKNSNLYKVVEHVGLDNIVLETDAPYLAPEPYRGRQNSSKYIPIIAEKVANILNVSLETVEEKTTATASNLFDL